MADDFCHVCFSKCHSMNLCDYRYKRFILFPPNIDADLYKRFAEILTLQERYLFIFSYPQVHDSMNVKPIKILAEDEIYFSNIEAFMNPDLILADYVQQNFASGNLSPRIPWITFRIKHLEIVSPFPPQNLLNISSQELFHLLSMDTKILICDNVQFSLNLSFREILENVPNCEKINIWRTNVAVDDTWMDLLDNSRSLKFVSLLLAKFDNVNVEKLADLIKKKKNNIKIYLYIAAPRGKPTFNQHQVFKVIKKQLSSHFVPAQLSWKCLTISFKWETGAPGNFCSKGYELK